MSGVRQIASYAKPYKWITILAPLLMIVEVFMDLIQPTIMQHIIDSGIAKGDQNYVISMTFTMLFCALLGLIGGAGCSYFSAKAAVNFSTDLRRDLFEVMTYFSTKNREVVGTGKLITILTSDVEMVQRAFMMLLKVFVRGPLLFVGAVLIVWFTARPLFPILLVVVPILIIIILLFVKFSGRIFGKVQIILDEINTKLSETLAGMRVIKAFHQMNSQVQQFTGINKRLTKQMGKVSQILGLLGPLTMLIINLGIIAALWLGAIKIENNGMQVGTILAFINYLSIMMQGLMSSTMVLTQIARAIPSANRIADILTTKSELKEGQITTQVAGNVRFENVSFCYHEGSEAVLKDLSFDVTKGQVVGIIGRTGSGKTTILKLLARMYDPSEGKIFIENEDLRQLDLANYRRQIGIAPQKSHLFSGTILDNLLYADERASEKSIWRAIEQASATGFVTKMGLSGHLQQNATNLSGGQKQRLAMARAFLRQPAILVLDDTTSAVDMISERKIQKHIQENFNESTVFIVSSKISSIKHADQILLLDDGALVGKGTHEQLLKTNTMYQAIAETQKSRGVVIDE